MNRIRNALLWLAGLGSAPAMAQPELTAAVQVSYPFVVGRQGYYNSPAPAVCLQAGWRLPQSRLYPSVQLSFGSQQTALSAPASGYNDLNTEMRAYGGLLLLSAVLRGDEQNEWLLSAGIGATGLEAYTGGASSGANGTVAGLESVSGRLKPCAAGKAALRWLHRISSRRPLYLSCELGCQYLYLAEKDEYRLRFPRALIPATAAGHLLVPAAQLGICWLFRRE